MRRNRSRSELLAVSSMAVASGLFAGATPAQAQVALPNGSYQANGSFIGGGGTITTGAGTTDIAVRTPVAVINWSPFDASGNGVINFQPKDTTATFHNAGFGGDNFAVLNRIVNVDTSRPIVFNGTTISQIQGDVSTGPGGTVFFYSPGGILVGPTAVFDVGNLVLTTSDLAYDASGNTFDTNGTGVYKFLPAKPGTSVEIAKGASITSGGGSSYVALVAPKVVQSGTLNVDGSVALVAADAATIQFSPDGLFSITIDKLSDGSSGGTSATGTVLTSDGSITGPVGTAGTANHRIYMVAVPKNDAITLAISGGNSLGFDIAGKADVVGNSIVLSSGFDIVAGQAADTRSAGGGTGQADLVLHPGNYTSAVSGKATGQALLTVAAGETANFASDFTLAGTNSGVLFPVAAQITVTGMGATGESYFLHGQEDIPKFDAAGGLPAWQKGAEAIIDMYAKAFPTTPIILPAGAPIPGNAGEAALRQVLDYGFGRHPRHFGLIQCGLNAGAKAQFYLNGIIQSRSDQSPVGLQMAWSSKGNNAKLLKGTLREALDRGVELKAHWIEVYADDVRDPANSKDLEQAGKTLKGARRGN